VGACLFYHGSFVVFFQCFHLFEYTAVAEREKDARDPVAFAYTRLDACANAITREMHFDLCRRRSAVTSFR